ncbi:MAG: RimK family alpha-L-glutamate ligase [Planctomycetia bacterium]|nr:RimK family alpha-L-glutamate ligase [Planctomycetia bacterium]
MRAWLVVNHFVHAEKFETLYQMILKTAHSFEIDLECKTNVELMCAIDGVDADFPWERPDFVLFWDKDILLCKILERFGLPVFNCSYAIETCDNKALTTVALMKSGIRMPRTIAAPKTFAKTRYPETDWLASVGDALGFPLVLKESFGSFGFQVYLVRNLDELMRKTEEIGTRPMIFQELVKTSIGRDVRLQVVGNEVPAAVFRKAKEGDFRANVTNGGTMLPYTPTDAEAECAIRVAQILRADFVGVDLLFSDSEEPILCEANTNAHFKNLLDATGIDVGFDIFRHILNKMGRL